MADTAAIAVPDTISWIGASFGIRNPIDTAAIINPVTITTISNARLNNKVDSVSAFVVGFVAIAETAAETESLATFVNTAFTVSDSATETDSSTATFAGAIVINDTIEESEASTVAGNLTVTVVQSGVVPEKPE